jgi:hypothetical protein
MWDGKIMDQHQAGHGADVPNFLMKYDLRVVGAIDSVNTA